MIADSFKDRLRARERLIGTFLKTPSLQIMEVIATTALDFVVVDAEHAPFDRRDLDIGVMAAHARSMPVLVRVQDTADATLLNVLDIGANGVLVPHARSVEGVCDVLAAIRYRGGRRGFSNSPRAGDYGRAALAELVKRADKEAVGVFQVEDREAIERIDVLANLTDVDCLFIGRADLAVSLGVESLDDPLVAAAVAKICEAGRKVGKALGIFLPNALELEQYAALGISMFVIGSDQAFLRERIDILTQTETAQRRRNHTERI